ncbi:MAG: hypothetical protein OXU34_04730, partial [Gammaproteobacteria bacterium]|nr:hypothetical protein [Gammaproteobacteria bacterium]
MRIAVLLLLCLPLAAPVSAQAQQRETIFWLERVEEGTNNPTGEVLGRYGFLEEGDEFRVVVRYSLPFIVNDDIVLTFGTHLSDVSREDFARRDGTCLPVLLKSKKNPYTLNTGDIPFGLAYNINNPATHEGAIRLCRDGRAEDTETLIVQYVRNHGSGGIGLQIPTREELNLESVGYGIMANGRGPRVGINRVPASSSQDLRGIHIPEGDRVPGFAFNADYIHEEGTNRQFEVRLCNYVGSGGERIRATDDCRFAQRYTGARIGQSDLSFGFDSVRSTAETDDIRLRTSTDGSLSPDLDEWNPSTGIGIMHIPTARDTSVIDFQLVDDTAPETTETVIFILNLHSIGEVGARRLEPRPGRQYGFDYRPFLAAVIPPNDTFEANLTGLPSHQPDEGTTFTFTVNLADGDLPVRQDALALQIRDSVNSRPADATSDEWEFVSARRIFGDGRPPAAATGYTERGTADLAQICPTSAGGYRDRVVAGRVTGNPVDLQELIYDCDLGFHVTTGTRQIEVTLRVRDDDVREVDPRLYIRVAAVPANHPSHGHRYENQWREIRLAPSELFLNPPSLSFRPTVTRNERTTYIVNSNINPDSGASGQGLVTTWRWLLRDLAGNDVSARYGFTFDTMTIMGTEATSSEVRFNLPDVVVRETLRFCVEANSGADRFRDSRFNESCSLVHVNDTETPSADAGANPGPLPDDEPFTLHGSGSDPDDDPGLTYRWEQTSPAPDGDGLNPEVAFGSHANSTGTVTVTLPDLPAGTTAGFTLKLTVADSAVAGRASLTSTDTVAIVVHDSTPPTAAAGADQAVGTGGVMIALDGGVSHDARGPGFTGTDRLRYRWQQVESDDPAAAAVGTVGPIANATAATATFTAPTTAGHYYFRLT